jgi:hypothetical protein
MQYVLTEEEMKHFREAEKVAREKALTDEEAEVLRKFMLKMDGIRCVHDDRKDGLGPVPSYCDRCPLWLIWEEQPLGSRISRKVCRLSIEVSK